MYDHNLHQYIMSFACDMKISSRYGITTTSCESAPTRVRKAADLDERERERVVIIMSDTQKDHGDQTWCKHSWTVATADGFKSTDRLDLLLKTWCTQVDFILGNCQLCTLATQGRRVAVGDGTSTQAMLDCHVSAYPETSLMFYAYDPAACEVVFTTPTTGDIKFKNISSYSKCSLLIHNYEGAAASRSLLHEQPGLALTLYGTARIVNTMDEEKKSREAIADQANEENSAYAKDGAAVIKVEIEGLLLVNSKGEVLRLIRKDLC